MHRVPRPAGRSLSSGGCGLLRRDLLGTALLLPALTIGAAHAAPSKRVDGLDAGLRPNEPGDQTDAFQRAVARSVRDNAVLQLGAGRYRIGGVVLPAGTHIQGASSGKTFLMRSGDGAALSARGGDDLSLERLSVEDHAGSRSGEPLIRLADIRRLRLTGITVAGAAGTGLHLERCGGTIDGSLFKDLQLGIFSLDSLGLRITGNDVLRCRDNGIQVWRSQKGYDGSQVTGNRISEIEARSGGSGQNGNAINIYRAGGVLVSGNTMRRCAFTAVRNNAGDDVQILGNSCTELGETAIYAEFAFEGCVISGNVVDGAASGILITNFNEGGRLSVCQGNIVRNLRRKPNVETGRPDYGIGIAAEADTSVTGNVIDRADYAGLSLGYGPHLRDVVCASNIVRDARYGIAVSVAPDAGLAHITGNTLSRCRDGAIVGMEWEKAVSPDLVEAAGGRFRNVVLTGNLRGERAL